MSNKRPMNLERVLRAYRAFKKEYEESGLCAIHHDDILVDIEALCEIAPPEIWRWDKRNHATEKYQWEAAVTYKGVVFCALCTQEEYERYTAERVVLVDTAKGVE
jgi:hypothetical protein